MLSVLLSLERREIPKLITYDGISLAHLVWHLDD